MLQLFDLNSPRNQVAGPQVVELLVKWRELGYDLSTWEELPAIQSQPGAQPALERLRSLRPIGQTVRLRLRL